MLPSVSTSAAKVVRLKVPETEGGYSGLLGAFGAGPDTSAEVSDPERAPSSPRGAETTARLAPRRPWDRKRGEQPQQQSLPSPTSTMSTLPVGTTLPLMPPPPASGKSPSTKPRMMLVPRPGSALRPTTAPVVPSTTAATSRATSISLITNVATAAGGGGSGGGSGGTTATGSSQADHSGPPRRFISPTGWTTFSITSRAWIHNTSYFRDGPALWEVFVADVALFTVARRAMQRSASLRVWSCGCSSGEELYTAQMIYQRWVAPSLGAHAPAFEGCGTDRDKSIIATCCNKHYSWSEAALAGLPCELREAFFEEVPTTATGLGDEAGAGANPVSGATNASLAFAFFDQLPVPRRFLLSERARAGCTFDVEDTTTVSSSEQATSGAFDLIFCRYSIFLYSTEALARVALESIVDRLAPGGLLVLGASDNMPQGAPAAHGLQPLGSAELNVWQRRPTTAAPEPRASAEASAPAAACNALGEALAKAGSLSEFRQLIGLPARFSAEVAETPIGVRINQSSIDILRSSEMATFYDKPMAKRTLEYQRRQKERIDSLRVQRRQAEDDEIRRGLEERDALRTANSKRDILSDKGPRKPLLERLREEAEAQERRRRKLEEETLAQYGARWGTRFRLKAKNKRAR